MLSDLSTGKRSPTYVIASDARALVVDPAPDADVYVARAAELGRRSPTSSTPTCTPITSKSRRLPPRQCGFRHAPAQITVAVGDHAQRQCCHVCQRPTRRGWGLAMLVKIGSPARSKTALSTTPRASVNGSLVRDHRGSGDWKSNLKPTRVRTSGGYPLRRSCSPTKTVHRQSIGASQTGPLVLLRAGARPAPTT